MYSAWKGSGRKNDVDRAKEKFFSIINGSNDLERQISEYAEKRLLQIIERIDLL
jgi:hypothetical protein